MFKNFTIKQSYTIIFVVLIFWASFAYYTMHSLISSQSYYAKLINLSGKQRMLSQKGAFLVSKVIQNQHNQELKIHLQNVVDEFKSNHLFIIENLSNQAKKFYFEPPIGLDKQARFYVQLLEEFVISPSKAKESVIFQDSQALLINLDKAVSIFQNESEIKTKSLQQQELYILLGTIMTIILEAYFFARPVIEKMNLKFQDFYEQLRLKDHQIHLQSQFFQNAFEGIVITNEKNQIIDLNPAYEKITGYSKEFLLGKNPSVLKSKEQTKEFYENMWSKINKDGFFQGKIINKKKDNIDYVQDVSIFALKDEQGKVTNYFALVKDDTQEYLTQQKLYSLANFDTLTQVYNRNAFFEKLERIIYENDRIKKRFALIYVDLDNFKIINDTLGHDGGDTYLVAFSTIVKDTLRKSDILARVGGDEFIIVLDKIEAVDSVYSFFSRLFENFSQDIQIKGTTCKLSASFGIGIFPDDAHNSTELVKYADLAMYESKKNGRNQFTFYNDEFEKKLLDDLQLEKDIKYALDNKEFY
ncbi:MAG: diguanylate cyclase [Campylobacterales bacterium]|nr:diguanylate cyclase [Campylobacterales bacterium]